MREERNQRKECGRVEWNDLSIIPGKLKGGFLAYDYWNSSCDWSCAQVWMELEEKPSPPSLISKFC